MKEAEGNVQEAAEILQEVAVVGYQASFSGCGVQRSVAC
jgi:hypothetical protein